jgi:hypothetical protein
MTNGHDPSAFRYAIGALAIVGGLIGLGGLYFIQIPEGNKEPLLLALGIVLGWGATVIGYEFGSSPSGRKAAEAGISASVELAGSNARIAEQAATAAIVAPTPEPQKVEVVNTAEAPVPTSIEPAPEQDEGIPDYARP